MKMKETFCSYADFNDADTKKIHEEMEELKNELDKTRNIVRVQRVRYQQLVSLFSAKLQEKEEETRNDLQIKHIQLTRILRALYILEAKLRKEQRYLKNTLMERDALIKTQQHQIGELKKQIEKITQNRCADCMEANAKEMQNKTAGVEPKSADNKPDLISSIGIEIRKDTADDSRLPVEREPVSNKLENDEENTYVISSLDDYDASLSSLHVRGASADETKQTFPQTGSGDGKVEDNQNANNENLRNRIIDEELQNEMRKFKMKDNEGEETFKTSPRMILKEVTENPNEKLNGPVLKCVKQILSIDKETSKTCNNKPPAKASKTENLAEIGKTIERMPDSSENSCDIHTANHKRRQHPAKPPKPNFAESVTLSHKNNEHNRSARFETNVSKAFVYENTLSVRPLQKCEKNQKTVSNPKCPDDSLNDAFEAETGEDGVNGNENVYETVATDESRIVQTVAALLSESAESEDEKSATSPTVSQMVKKFEGLKCNKKIGSKQALNSSKNDSMVFQTNFEEFHLVDKEIDTTCEDIVKDNAIRLEAEGEENSTATTVVETTNTSNAKYETFLEVTGLSQKSILTPSRILSNHRNVVKPKDVKYRNRIKAAAVGEKCINGNAITSPTMKYWTEPYL